MESFDDAPFLPIDEEHSSLPISQRELKRSRKASRPRVSEPPIASTLDPDPSNTSASEVLPDAREVPDLERSAADAVDPAPASEDPGKDMAADDELDPLFPDPRDASKFGQPWNKEGGEEEEGWLGGSSWGGESGRIGNGGIMDLGTVKSRLSKNWYNSPQEFAEDVRLTTFRSAMTYNPEGQDVHIMAKQLSRYLRSGGLPSELSLPTFPGHLCPRSIHRLI